VKEADYQRVKSTPEARALRDAAKEWAEIPDAFHARARSTDVALMEAAIAFANLLRRVKA
jgi:hypothetical protein